MELKNKNIALGITGSFSLFKNTILQIKELVEAKANIFPIISYCAYKTDTKYGTAKDFIQEIEEITGKQVTHSMKKSEMILSKNIIDAMIIIPCTGNTIAKLSMGITDTPVLLASKLHLLKRKTFGNWYISS